MGEVKGKREGKVNRKVTNAGHGDERGEEKGEDMIVKVSLYGRGMETVELAWVGRSTLVYVDDPVRVLTNYNTN